MPAQVISYIDIPGPDEGDRDLGLRLTAAEARLQGPASLGAADLWAAFDSSGAAAESWSATTYSGWTSGLATHFASEISSGAVTVTDLGACSDGSNHIYSYKAGTGPYNVLIVSGQHGGETLGMWASMRWFEQFVRSDDPTYAAMQQLLTVTWIPSANPYGYNLGRKNANGVDLNRNHNLLWSSYTDAGGFGASDYKGTAAKSEPEAAIIDNLIDAGDFRVVLDCHNFSATGVNEGQIGLPGAYFLGARQFGIDVLKAWNTFNGVGYNTSYAHVNNTIPSLNNYASYVGRHVNGRGDCATALLEANADIGGSTYTNMSKRGARAYAGLIHMYLGMWLPRAGTEISKPFTYQMFHYRINQQDATTVAAGGGLIDTGSGVYNVITFNDSRPASGASSNSTLLVPVIVGPSLMTVQVTAQIATLAAASARLSFSLDIDGDDGANLVVGTVTTGAATGDVVSVAFAYCKQYSAVDNVNPRTVKVRVRKITGGNAGLRTVTCTVTVTPYTDGMQAGRTSGV